MEVDLANALMASPRHGEHATIRPSHSVVERTSALTTIVGESGLRSRAAIACAGIAVGAVGAMLLLWLRKARARRRSLAETARQADPIQHSEIIVLGCGSSTGVPRAACVVDPNSDCKTCRLAMIGPSELNRNWRGNPSILIRYVVPNSAGSSDSNASGATASAASSSASSSSSSTTPTVRNIQIDIGKTFLASALRFFPRFGVRSLDSVLITHDHADAILGFDDIRSMQKFEEDGSAVSVPIHVSQKTLLSVRQKFHYLVPKEDAHTTVPPVEDCCAAVASSHSSHSSSSDAAAAPAVIAVVERKVAQLSWSVMRPFVPLRTCGLDVLPLPVLHGEDYVSLGFLFGTGLGMGPGAHEACLYISDVTRIPETTWNFLCTGQLPTPPSPSSAAAAATHSANNADDATVAASSSSASAASASSASSSSSSSSDGSWFERFNSAHAHPLPRDQSSWRLMPDSPASPQAGAPRIALLVVDALFPVLEHTTHFNLNQALMFIQRLRPRRAIITGMSDLFEYEADQAELLRRRRSGELTVDVDLAYDGMRIPINL